MTSFDMSICIRKTWSDNEKSGDGIRINISNSGIKSKIVGLTIIIVGLILS